MGYLDPFRCRFSSALFDFNSEYSDPHGFNADPDKTFFIIADPDPIPDLGF